MRPSGNVLACLVLIALFAVALAAAQGFRAQARLFPTLIAIAGLGFTLLQLVIELRKSRAPVIQDAVVLPFGPLSHDEDDVPVEAEIPPDVKRRRTFVILGWVLGFAASAWAIGFIPSVPLYMLAYLRLDARESWRTSVIFAVVSGAVFYGLFGVAVRIPFDDGFLVALALDILGL